MSLIGLQMARKNVKALGSGSVTYGKVDARDVGTFVIIGVTAFAFTAMAVAMDSDYNKTHAYLDFKTVDKAVVCEQTFDGNKHNTIITGVSGIDSEKTAQALFDAGYSSADALIYTGISQQAVEDITSKMDIKVIYLPQKYFDNIAQQLSEQGKDVVLCEEDSFDFGYVASMDLSPEGGDVIKFGDKSLFIAKEGAAYDTELYKDAAEFTQTGMEFHLRSWEMVREVQDRNERKSNQTELTREKFNGGAIEVSEELKAEAMAKEEIETERE